MPDMIALGDIQRERIPQLKGSFILSPCWYSPLGLGINRLLDIMASAALLFLLSPVFLILAIAVKPGSRGKVFYKWKVVGCGGRPFTGFKFRSMIVNADELRAQLESRNEMTGPVFKIADDPRITRVGAWLRKYSLDEICRISVSRALSGEPLIIYEDGQQTRAFVHIKDVVDANMPVLEKEGANKQAFDVGSGHSTTLLEYAQLVRDKVGTDI